MRREQRAQLLVGLGMFAIGLVAFLLDDHDAASWKDLSAHQMVQLGVAAIGLLVTPFDLTPVKEKVAIIATVVPWVRRPSTGAKKPEGEA